MPILVDGDFIHKRKELFYIMTKQISRWRQFWQSVWVGIVAGMISGMVKIGWEKILPPRTLARDATNPPQRMLEQLGATSKFVHTYIYYNTDQKVYWVALILHFSFSIFFAWLLIYLVQYDKLSWLGKWQGALYGIIIWVAWHLIIMPALGTTPAPWNEPFAEHFSEFFGHIVWAWAIVAVAYFMIEKWPSYDLTTDNL